MLPRTSTQSPLFGACLQAKRGRRVLGAGSRRWGTSGGGALGGGPPGGFCGGWGLGWDPVQIPVTNTTPQAAKGQKRLPWACPTAPFLPLPPPPTSNEGLLDQHQPQDPGPRAQPTPTVGLGSMPTGQAPPEPQPAASPIPGSTCPLHPRLHWGDSHLPQESDSELQTISFKGFLVGLDEREEVLGLRQTQHLSPVPTLGWEASQDKTLLTGNTPSRGPGSREERPPSSPPGGPGPSPRRSLCRGAGLRGGR